MIDLPAELILNIVEHCDIIDIERLRVTCRYLIDAIEPIIGHKTLSIEQVFGVWIRNTRAASVAYDVGRPKYNRLTCSSPIGCLMCKRSLVGRMRYFKCDHCPYHICDSCAFDFRGHFKFNFGVCVFQERHYTCPRCRLLQ